MSFKTVSRLESPTVGNVRVSQETREDGSVTNHYKFIGSRALTLQEVVELHESLGVPVSDALASTLDSKRSGYKFKTTWSV